jgi:hypothetical protein
MRTWVDLEERFRALEVSLQFSRLDRQFGTDGESWRVAAVGDSIAVSRFEALAAISGRKLREEGLAAQLSDEVASAPDDRTRWYRALCRSLRFYQPGFVGHYNDDEGNPVGWIGTASVNKPAAVAAATCLELAAMTTDNSSSTGPALTINVSGHNSRVNLSSVDNSVNTVGVDAKQIFNQIREAIQQGITGEQQAHVLSKLKELEEAVAKPTFTERYASFMQLVANHATVLAPFLPALASLLPK